jgi:hypothetical protein
LKYRIPTDDLRKLDAVNAKPDQHGRWDAVMSDEGRRLVHRRSGAVAIAAP